jgi:uncharacterized protein
MYFLLLYDYVDGMLERRPPHREAHLGHARSALTRGELLMAGAFAEPVDGAALLFCVVDAAVVESFVKKDPYVAAGLVKSWRIRAWNVVLSAPTRTDV